MGKLIFMAEKYPSPNLNWPTQEATRTPTTFQWTSQQQPDKFQASRDWCWVQHAPTAPFNPNTTTTFTGYWGPGYQQHRFSGPQHYQSQRQGHGQNQWNKRKQNYEQDYSHFCDTCDRGFKNQAKYDDHIAQHVKCSVDDCIYTAHEKLVRIHWKNNHSPGAKRIKLDTPDEIEKWREERRRNYPTLSNVKKKIRLTEVKEKRGDVLETAQFGRFKSRGKGFQNHKGSAFGRDQRLHSDYKEVQQTLQLACTSHIGDPLGALANNDPESEKEESAKELKVSVSVAPKHMTFALGSLMSSYGGMSESDDEPEDFSNPAQNSIQKLERMPNEQSKISHKVLHHPSRKSNRGGSRNFDSRSASKKCHPTLLEMLLAPDIRHERNVVLQCVRYIIHNGFFSMTCNDCFNN